MGKSAKTKSKSGKGKDGGKSSTGNPLQFTYDLGGRKPAVWKAGNSREVSVRELPVSKGIAGVSMRLKPGEVFYIPQGCGHFLENVGGKGAEILLVFDNGVYQEIRISEWIADTPTEVVSAVFGVSGKVVKEFPRQEVFISGGKR